MAVNRHRKLEKALKVDEKISKLDIKNITSDIFDGVITKDMRKLQKLANKSIKLFREAIDD